MILAEWSTFMLHSNGMIAPSPSNIWLGIVLPVACTINVFTIVIYDRNDSSQYYKTMIVVEASLSLPWLG
jgi:hypothetical protein